MQTQFSGSAYQARAILGAWHSGDRKRLQAELDRVSGLTAANPAEEERLELLSEIARELRSARQTSDTGLYGSLLEHLAFSGQETQPRLRTRRPSGCARAATAAVLQ